MKIPFQIPLEFNTHEVVEVDLNKMILTPNIVRNWRLKHHIPNTPPINTKHRTKKFILAILIWKKLLQAIANSINLERFLRDRKEQASLPMKILKVENLELSKVTATINKTSMIVNLKTESKESMKQKTIRF